MTRWTNLSLPTPPSCSHRTNLPRTMKSWSWKSHNVYIVKRLKSQIPYSGKIWRALNLVISAIWSLNQNVNLMVSCYIKAEKIVLQSWLGHFRCHTSRFCPLLWCVLIVLRGETTLELVGPQLAEHASYTLVSDTSFLPEEREESPDIAFSGKYMQVSFLKYWYSA